MEMQRSRAERLLSERQCTSAIAPSKAPRALLSYPVATRETVAIGTIRQKGAALSQS